MDLGHGGSGLAVFGLAGDIWSLKVFRWTGVAEVSHTPMGSPKTGFDDPGFFSTTDGLV